MKHFLITIFLTLSISCSTYAQNAIYYGYDAAGTRIYRELRSQPGKRMRKQMDGDTLNILLLFNQDFIKAAEAIISPRQMFISKNDGKCNGDMIHSRDTIINANSMKSLSKYTDEEISRIIRLQNMQ